MVARALIAALAASSLAVTASGQGMYSKNSAVLQVDAKSYNKVINKSNKVSIVEFYAPWCGHCQNLKPKYEKAAKSLKDLAQVAAVDCDDDSNKPLCASMGVKGFPTLKIVKPSKKTGKPIVEDYPGPRESNEIVEHVKRSIPNNVKRITDKSLEQWLEADQSTTKAILFSDKGVTSALTKVLANEFVGSLNFAQIRDKEATSNEKFGITEYPTLLVLPAGSEEPVFYEGAYTKAAMKDFLSKYASPSDSQTVKEKVKEKAQKIINKKSGEGEAEVPKPAQDEESSFSSASSAHKSTETSSDEAAATSETLEEDNQPTESPEPAVTPEAKPIPVPDQPDPIAALEGQDELFTKCLGEKTPTCVLALLPAVPDDVDQTLDEPATLALASLAEVAQKHRDRNGNLFPFYAVPASNPGAKVIREALALQGAIELELIAVNGRRGWFRHYEAGKYDSLSVESWIDNIRFGEGAKGKLPEELLASAEPAPEKEEEKAAAEESAAPSPESEEAPRHEEL